MTKEQEIALLKQDILDYHKMKGPQNAYRTAESDAQVDEHIANAEKRLAELRAA